MDILILTHFTSTFSETDNDRFLYIAKELAKDHSIEILTSDFCHEKKSHRNKTENEWPFKVTFLREKGYPKNVCLRRFYSHFLWGLEVNRYLRKRKKPDAVYCAVPSLTGPYMAAKYCKRNNIHFIIDLQDLWPEAFQMIVHLPLLCKIVFWPLQKYADEIYRRADDVVAVSSTYVERVLRVNDNILCAKAVYLGTDLTTFDDNAKISTGFVKCDGEFWLGYCGTLGTSYDIKCVIDALAYLKEHHMACPKFIVMGDGPLKTEFEAYATNKTIDAYFLGRIPYNKMCSILSQCDMTVNPIVGSSVASIINKHADYAASGLPVINTQNSKEYRSLVEKYGMGINIPSGDYIEVAKAIEKLCGDDTLRKQMGQGARKCAKECFDRKCTYKNIVELILK